MKETLARKVTALTRSSGTMGLVRRRLAGQGVIIMLHEVQDDPAPGLSGACPAETLDWMLRWLRQEGWEFVSLDEASRRMRQGDDAAPRFAVFTFDDGYRDTLTHATPVMERHGAPFTVYVPTHAVNRELYSWWLGLRALFQNHDSVAMSSIGRRYQCGTLNEKIAALQDIADWVQEDYSRSQMLAEDFRTHDIFLPELNEQAFLDEAGLRKLAQHPLVTIGGHTVSHPALACLDDTSAHREIADNRRFLQQLLDRPVDHFAYPYGTARACTLRDADLAALAGYSTAVTTRYDTIRQKGLNTHFLPRIAPPNEIEPCALDGRVSGLYSAMAAAARPFGMAGRH